MSQPLIDRVQTLLSNLVTAIELRGGEVVPGEKGLEVKIEGHQLCLLVKEKFDRVPHVMTEKEKADVARDQAKVAASKDPWSFSLRYDAPKIPQHDYRPTGKLSLLLEEKVGYRGVRRTFSDRVSLRVEMMVDEIADAMWGYAKAQQEWLDEQERQRLESEERAKQAAIARKRQELEVRRIEFLDRQLARVDRIGAIERLLASLGQMSEEGEGARFREWASGYVHMLRREIAPEVLSAKLAKTRLMDDDTDVPDWIDVATGEWRARPRSHD